jgi:hypothetical protein
MRQFIMTVTALAAFGALVTTVHADVLNGAPLQNGTKCFKLSPGRPVDQRFGYWGACPQPASTRTAAPRQQQPVVDSGPNRQTGPKNQNH